MRLFFWFIIWYDKIHMRKNSSSFFVYFPSKNFLILYFFFKTSAGVRASKWPLQYMQLGLLNISSSTPRLLLRLVPLLLWLLLLLLSNCGDVILLSLDFIKLLILFWKLCLLEPLPLFIFGLSAPGDPFRLTSNESSESEEMCELLMSRWLNFILVWVSFSSSTIYASSSSPCIASAIFSLIGFLRYIELSCDLPRTWTEFCLVMKLLLIFWRRWSRTSTSAMPPTPRRFLSATF